jgi:hypothetical protein
MEFSIIIPTTTGRESSGKPFARTFAKLTVDGDWELLVVDNKSPITLGRWLKRKGVLSCAVAYLFEPERGATRPQFGNPRRSKRENIYRQTATS